LVVFLARFLQHTESGENGRPSRKPGAPKGDIGYGNSRVTFGQQNASRNGEDGFWFPRRSGQDTNTREDK